MPVTQVGVVYYPDDPHKRVFRRVYPASDDSELDGPVTGGAGQPIVDADGNGDWHTYGLGPSYVAAPRIAQMDKVAAPDTAFRLRGTPLTLASEPVVYWMNWAAPFASLTKAQQIAMMQKFNTFVAANPAWSNTFVDLGTGTPSALAAGVVSPAWIVIVGGGDPGIGTQQKQATVSGNSVALWVV